MSPANQNLPYVILKTKFPFIHASTSLDIKISTIASNRSFESCMSIPCLAPKNVFRFFHFCRGFCHCLLQFCSILRRPPHRSTKTFPGKSSSIVIDARRSRCPFGLRFQEARKSPGVARVVCESLGAKLSHLIFSLGTRAQMGSNLKSPISCPTSYLIVLNSSCKARLRKPLFVLGVGTGR